jgi:hypothetical protein
MDFWFENKPSGNPERNEKRGPRFDPLADKKAGGNPTVVCYNASVMKICNFFK